MRKPLKHLIHFRVPVDIIKMQVVHKNTNCLLLDLFLSMDHVILVLLHNFDGYYLRGSPIMVCNQTVWFKREFSCIGTLLLWRTKSVLGSMRKIAHLNNKLTGNKIV